jgi:hypothetical protein
VRSTLNRSRLAAVLGALAAGLLLTAPAASASDTFVLENDSSVATLTGTSLWGKGHTMNAGCRTGPFPGPTLKSFTFGPGTEGTITLSQDPFSKCLPGINPLVDNPLTAPQLTSGFWDWIPIDPFVGYATLHCDTEGQYGSGTPIQSQVNGLQCNYYDAGPSSAGTFTASAAPVRGGKAIALVQHHPGSAEGAPEGSSSQARYELVLKGHGRTKATIVSGDSRKVRVPISRALRKLVAEKGVVKVKAVLKRVDGQPGSGDRAVIAVMKDHKSLPF